MLRYQPQPDAGSAAFAEDDIAVGAERYDRLFGKALTRAGWQLPSIDPDALNRITCRRRQPDGRLEFILDTNAMMEGIGHWLAALFAERCDLVVTAVSLRELQDQYGAAKFDAPLSKIVGPNSTRAFEKDVLGRRQAYLSAVRFRECVGFDRILWRELELEDAPLMLSRSGLDKNHKKSSEADTALLREVRRSIRDRVQGLERFFVTSDVALSRRAATELPRESIIAARVRDLVRGAVYAPFVWWPAGADQGATLAGHTPMRLLWELLSIADELCLRLKKSPDRAWTLKAFEPEMWPSDYLAPWIDCIGPALVTQSATPARVDEAIRPPSRATAFEEPLFPPVDCPNAPNIDANLRVGSGLLLNALTALVQHKAELSFEEEAPSPEAERHLRSLLESLRLARVVGRKVEPLARLPSLISAWVSGDREMVSRLLRPYRAFTEQVDPQVKGSKRPGRTLELARGLASRLGQGMFLNGTWMPGGATPKLQDVREAILAASNGNALTILDLFVNVFLGRLAVTPVRAMEAWDRMESAGVFDGMEFRRGGGPPSRAHVERVVTLSQNGWKEESLPFDSFRGYRDLVVRVANAD